MKFPKYAVSVGALVILIGASIAIAQVTVPKVLSVGPTDLFQDVVGGVPGPGNTYATAAQVNGVAGYKLGGAVLTAWTYTFTSGQQYYVITPSGTLATGVLTAEANPGDGQRECFFSTQTQTAITWTANTGQTMDTTKPAAGVANVRQCMLYSAAAATWYRVE